MKICDKFRNEKLYYNINREVKKILVLSTGKIDKYHYFTRKFKCFKTNRIQTKIKIKWRNFPRDIGNNEIKNELKSRKLNKKSSEMIWNMKKVNTYMLFRSFKRVAIIIMAKLQYLKLIKNKMVF